MASNTNKHNLTVHYVSIDELDPAPYNPRKWDEEATNRLHDSIHRFGVVDPVIVNSAKARKNTVIGGHFRLEVARQIGYKTVPVVYVNIADEAQERELNLRLNKAVGDWDWDMLAEFDENLLGNVGFTSEELDDIFDIETDEPEHFDLQKELDKLGIKQVEAQKGDVYQLGEHKLLVGDSTVEEDMHKLMDGEQADMVLTDPPYILDYLNAKRHGNPTEGFGAKRNRKYLETDELPDNFTELWMANVNSVAKPDFSIIVYENWKNLRTIWNEMEKYWTVKNMIVWHLQNRHQGFAAKHKFFSKYDVAMVGASGEVDFNQIDEPDGLQEEYETALFAICGDPHWEGYKKGGKYVPTDFIDYRASDEQSSGQGVIFGTKPVEILIPYLKVLTKRGQLVLEPFCGSGSTLIAASRLRRRCYTIEKSPVYAEVAMKRWENETGLKREKLA